MAPNYAQLRHILTEIFGQETIQQLTDENVRSFGDFLLLCGEINHRLASSRTDGMMQQGLQNSPHDHL